MFKYVIFISINRNIVECKDMRKSGLLGYPVSINRNIVECKDAYSGVNWCGCLPRINRNIVECKDTLIITPLKTYDPY